MAAEGYTLRDGIETVRQLPSPGQTFPLDHNEAPADNGRSFLVGRNIKQRDIDNRMPTDEITGLPHVILPVEWPYLSDSRDEVNYHHHFYDKRHPDLEGQAKFDHEILSHPEDLPLNRLAGLAVRLSRGQRLPVELHRLTHKEYTVGPVLPHTIDEKFVTAVKACSGIVSRWALDITAPSKNKLVLMDDDLFSKVASPELLCMESEYISQAAENRRRVLGNFFLRYATMQDISHVSEILIDEFLHTKNSSKRLRNANILLGEAIEVGIAPVVPICHSMKKQGYVQPGRGELRATVWNYILNPDRRATVYDELEKKFLAAA